MKSTHLKRVAWIKAGYSFRKIIPDSSGNVAVVQMKDVCKNKSIQWNKLIHTHLTGRAKPSWLESGDILFIARGNNNFAVQIDDVPKRVVCSPYFYQILVKDEIELLPEFLVWWLNQRPAQKYFEIFAEGSTTLSISRAVLENTKVVIPDLDTQKKIINLELYLLEEEILVNELIDNNKKYMKVLAYELDKEFQLNG